MYGIVFIAGINFVALFLPTLHYRRIRGDLIETYKIVIGKYRPDVAPTLYKSSVHVTRGNDNYET